MRGVSANVFDKTEEELFFESLQATSVMVASIRSRCSPAAPREEESHAVPNAAAIRGRHRHAFRAYARSTAAAGRFESPCGASAGIRALVPGARNKCRILWVQPTRYRPLRVRLGPAEAGPLREGKGERQAPLRAHRAAPFPSLRRAAFAARAPCRTAAARPDALLHPEGEEACGVLPLRARPRIIKLFRRPRVSTPKAKDIRKTT